MIRIRFDVSLHPLPGDSIAGPPLVDPHGTWPTIVPPPAAAGMTMAADFETALGVVAEHGAIAFGPEVAREGRHVVGNCTQLQDATDENMPDWASHTGIHNHAR